MGFLDKLENLLNNAEKKLDEKLADSNAQEQQMQQEQLPPPVFGFEVAPVHVQYETEFEWVMYFAKQGDADYQAKLGHFYLEGYGVKKDDRQAIEWFQRAAQQGNPDAIDILQQNGIGF